MSRRTVPGQSITRRLSGRGHTAARVGADTDFFHRLGVADPFALQAARDGSARTPSVGRKRLMDRLLDERQAERLGERLHRVGPVAWDFRASSMARFSATDDEFVTLIDGELVEDEPAVEEVAARPRSARRTRPARSRQRRPARPMARALARDGGHTGVAEVVEQILEVARGADRHKVRQLVQRVSRAPAARQAAEVRRVVRELSGPSRRAARAELQQVVGESGHRAIDVARGRSVPRREPGARGLRTVMSESPSVLAFDPPTAVTADDAAVTRVRPPRSPARAGRQPTRAPRAAAPPTRRTRAAAPASRPTAALARRFAAELQRPHDDAGRGLPSRTAERSPLRRVTARSHAGVVRADAPALMSSSATGWMREALSVRPLPVSDELVLARAPEREEGSEVGVEAATVAGRRSPLARTARARVQRRARDDQRAARDARGEARRPSATLRAATRLPGPTTSLASGPTAYVRAPLGVRSRPALARAIEARAPSPPRRPATSPIEPTFLTPEADVDLLAEEVAPRARRGRRPAERLVGGGAPANDSVATVHALARAAAPRGGRLLGRSPVGGQAVPLSQLVFAEPQSEIESYTADVESGRQLRASATRRVSARGQRRARVDSRGRSTLRAAAVLPTSAHTSGSTTAATARAFADARPAHRDGARDLGPLARASLRDAPAVRLSAGRPSVSSAALTHLDWSAEQASDWVESDGVPRPARKARRAAQRPPVARRPRAARAERSALPSPTKSAAPAWRVAERAAVGRRDDVLTPDATSYVHAAPQRVLAWLQPEADAPVEAGAPGASPSARLLERSRPAVRVDQAGRALLAPSSATRSRSSEAVAPQGVIERSLGRRGEQVSRTRDGRSAPLASEPVWVTGAPEVPADEGSDAAAQQRRRSERGRAARRVQSRRPTARVARAAARSEAITRASRVVVTRGRASQAPEAPHQRSTAPRRGAAAALARSSRRDLSETVLPRAVQDLDWSLLLGESEVAAAAEGGRASTRRQERLERAARPRRAERAARQAPEAILTLPEPAPPAAGEQPTATVGRAPLRRLARRTAAAVHASRRRKPSMMVVDASRRAAARSVPSETRQPTAIARVVTDARGRVQRVVMERPGSSERVELTLASAAAWAEERGEPAAAQGRARGPGARLADRSRAGVAGAGAVASRTPVATGGSGSPQPSSALGLGPMTLAALSAPPSDTTTEPGPSPSARDARSPAGRRSAAARGVRGRAPSAAADVASRPLLRTLASLVDGPRAARRGTEPTMRGLPAGTAPLAPEAVLPLGHDTTDDAGPQTAASPGESGRPGWVRRASGDAPGAERSTRPLPGPRLRAGTGLLTALARAGDAEEIVRVILERSDELQAELPSPARNLVRRIARTADGETRDSGGSSSSPRTLSLLRPVPVPVAGSGGGGSSSSPGQASRVMGLANKLMKLIHLAQNERRESDAQRQVRMSQSDAGTGAADTRPDVGAGKAGGESEEERVMNIKALRQDVIEAVLRELENIRWRREDPDGPSIWC